MTDHDKLLSDWKAQGFTGAFCHMYTSDWDDSDKKFFDSIGNALGFSFAIWSINHEKELIYKSHAWHTKFRKTWCLATIPTERFLLGKYLQIYVPFVNEERESARSAHTAVTAMLRLVLQPGIARELVAEGEFSFAENQSDWVTPGSFGRATLAEKHGLWFSSERIMQTFAQNNESYMTWKAARLIELAMKQDDQFLKFIALWNALEAILGDGEKRKIYFKKFGDIVNLAVKNLHDLRGAIIHEKDFPEKITEAHISLLLEVIRAAVLRGDEIRKVISERLQPICAQFNVGTLPETLDIGSTSHMIVRVGADRQP